MTCFCYLPSCLQCHPMLDDAWSIGTSIQLAGAESHRCTQLQGNARMVCREKEAAVGFQRSGPTNGRPDCSCLLPECETCSKRSMMAAPSSSAHALGRGNAMPGRGLRLIAAVHDELQQMLQEGEGWLAKGKGWDRIPSMRQDPHSYNASRLEKVVARLCGCSFWLVRKARSHSKKRDVAPMLRGRKRRRLEHATSSDGKESSKETFGGITALWEGGVEEASLQSTPARHRLGNVRGKFLPLAVGKPHTARDWLDTWPPHGLVVC